MKGNSVNFKVNNLHEAATIASTRPAYGKAYALLSVARDGNSSRALSMYQNTVFHTHMLPLHLSFRAIRQLTSHHNRQIVNLTNQFVC